MTDIDPNTPPANDNDPGTNPPADNGPEQDLTYWQKEAEKWKGLSRKHEDKWKTLDKEVSTLKEASMSDAEKALTDARKEGEKSGRQAATDRLVKAELKAMAATKGATLPDLDALNLSKFADEDGEPDEKAIEKFVDSLGSGSKFPNGGDLGIGRQSGGGKRQWTRADLQGKTHKEVVEAREAGHLDKLLGIGEFS
jgi:hypothetical protein